MPYFRATFNKYTLSPRLNNNIRLPPLILETKASRSVLLSSLNRLTATIMSSQHSVVGFRGASSSRSSLRDLLIRKVSTGEGGIIIIIRTIASRRQQVFNTY